MVLILDRGKEALLYSAANGSIWPFGQTGTAAEEEPIRSCKRSGSLGFNMGVSHPMRNIRSLGTLLKDCARDAGNVCSPGGSKMILALLLSNASFSRDSCPLFFRRMYTSEEIPSAISRVHEMRALPLRVARGLNVPS